MGQSLFHDDGGGAFNPSPNALDEATVNEWPGREVGVFISIGTGRRPRGTQQNSQVWYEGFMGEFAEARKKLIAKIENCENIHEYMEREHLLKRGVNVENYYRLNVEVGVGEFGMNEWHRLSDISTGTRRYLSKPEEQRIIQGSSSKLAKIHRAKERYVRLSNIPDISTVPPSATMDSWSSPLAVELPGDFPPPRVMQTTPSDRQSYESGIDRLSLPGSTPTYTPSPRSSSDRVRPQTSHASPPLQPNRVHQTSSQSPLVSAVKPTLDDPDRLVVTAPTPAQYRNGAGMDKIMITSPDEAPRRQQSIPIMQASQQQAHRIEPLAPPRPPKTPLQEDVKGPSHRRPAGGATPPYVTPYPMDDDLPPPVVNMAKKPNYRAR